MDLGPGFGSWDLGLDMGLTKIFDILCTHQVPGQCTYRSSPSQVGAWPPCLTGEYFATKIEQQKNGPIIEDIDI